MNIELAILNKLIKPSVLYHRRLTIDRTQQKGLRSKRINPLRQAKAQGGYFLLRTVSIKIINVVKFTEYIMASNNVMASPPFSGNEPKPHCETGAIVYLLL